MEILTLKNIQKS